MMLDGPSSICSRTNLPPIKTVLNKSNKPNLFTNSLYNHRTLATKHVPTDGVDAQPLTINRHNEYWRVVATGQIITGALRLLNSSNRYTSDARADKRLKPLLHIPIQPLKRLNPLLVLILSILLDLFLLKFLL